MGTILKQMFSVKIHSYSRDDNPNSMSIPSKTQEQEDSPEWVLALIIINFFFFDS